MKGKPQVVTSAFGYSGKYIARRLLAQGVRVKTLTNSPDRENPFGVRVEVHPFHFDRPEKLLFSLEGLSCAILRPALLFGKEKPILPVPPAAGYAVAKLLGRWPGDVILTSEEIRALMDELLYVNTPGVEKKLLIQRAKEHAWLLGRPYQSELKRRLNRRSAYLDNSGEKGPHLEEAARPPILEPWSFP